MTRIDTTPPASPSVGDTFYDTDQREFHIWTGHVWKALAPKPIEKFIFFKDNYAVISNYRFYVDNEDEIEQWLKENCNQVTREGMVIHFPQAEDRTLFALRWAGDAV